MFIQVIKVALIAVCVSAGYLRRKSVFDSSEELDVTHAPPINSKNVPILYPPSSPPRHCHEKHDGNWEHPKNRHSHEEGDFDSTFTKTEEATRYQNEDSIDSSIDNYKYKPKHKDEVGYDDPKYQVDIYYDNPKFDHNYGEAIIADNKRPGKDLKKGFKSKGRTGKSIRDNSGRKNTKPMPLRNDFNVVVNKSGNGLHLFRVSDGAPSHHERFY